MNTCEATTLPRPPWISSPAPQRVLTSPIRIGCGTLSELGLTELTIPPGPGRAACEGVLWGALREGGRLGDLVIVSDGAGQFRVGKTGYAALDNLLRLRTG
jgi:hypothetical protein